MEILYIIAFFIIGTIISSFLTVVGIRLPKEENFISERSKCDICNHQLKLYEMIPIFSYLIKKGKCSYCHNNISFVMPLIELLTGIFFAVSYYSFGISYELLIALGIVSMFVIICITDINYFIIPDEVLIFFGIYFIVIQYFNIGLVGLLEHIISGLFLFTLMYCIMLLGNKMFKKESLGGGDIKMMFVFGLILNPLLGSISIFVASLIALPISFYYLKHEEEKQIPFGPFLILALLLIYFTKITSSDIINLLNIK